MNDDGQPRFPGAEVCFDRLVDGELDEGEYRALLASLDDEPDGWRRCAMAFLESQAWERDLRGVVRDTQAETCGKEGPPARRSRRWLQVLPLLLTAAASFALALPLGANLPGLWQDGVTLSPVAGPVTDVFKPSLDGQQQPPMLTAGGPRQGDPIENLVLTVDGVNGQTREIEVPVFRQDGFSRSWLEQSTPMPLEVQRALYRLGYEVRRDRQWRQVPLKGQRSGYLPIEQVEITPVAFVP